ncbi:MAG: TetR/AcrR family transcriptional regulator [Pseudomonadaceae bacterium]|nr:TetR/AcrR family transcriptional regulator [Pseudomonadaceae bacterium]
MAVATEKKRTRMAPHARAKAIVEAARGIVLREGLANMTMERVAEAAAVSKGLIYAYFPNLTALLREVYARESRALGRAHMAVLEQPLSFEDMARATAQINRTSARDKQLLIKRLSADPSVAEAMDAVRSEDKQRVIDVLVEQVTQSYAIPTPVARKAVMLALGFDEEDAVSQDDEQMDEIWGAMMSGAMQELEKRYQEPTVKEQL